MSTRGPSKTPLHEACLREALEMIATEGLEALNLRAIARRLGVSHQAPYKHFSSRDHLLAEVIRRCLADFAAYLRASGEGGDPLAQMHALGEAYLGYALSRPLEYQLMFATEWPEVAHQAELGVDARAAFDVLCLRLSALRPDLAGRALDREAMFVWSAMHGVAGVLQSGAMRYLGMDGDEQRAVVAHVNDLVDRAISPT
ncbi:MAG: TetR/AcrR family transcriptional regulator [Pseudomonadota bacterium]